MYVVWEQLSEPLEGGVTFVSGDLADDALVVPGASLSKEGADVAGITFRSRNFIKEDTDSLTNSLREPIPVLNDFPRDSSGVV
jgi:hypothetical protein